MSLLLLARAAANHRKTTWSTTHVASGITLSNGNLTATRNGISNFFESVKATLGVDASSPGGRMFEIYIDEATTSPFCTIGIATYAAPVSANACGQDSEGWAYYQQTGQSYHSNSLASYGTAYATGDRIAVFLRAGKLWFAKNGTWQNSGDPNSNTGEAFSGISGIVFPMISLYSVSPPPHQMTGRFSATDIVTTIPTGGAPWGA